MKYVVVLGDGMADEPIEALNGKTPIQAAKTKALDKMAPVSEVGLVHTVPEGMNPGSDVANLAVMGYNPLAYYSGRSPLEALSIGVEMEDTDISLRCNIVTVSDEEENYADKTIIDHSSGEISSEEAAELIEAVKPLMQNATYQFYAGTSYRHLTIWKKGEVVDLVPPHDVLGQTIGQYFPKQKDLRDMMEKSYEILNNHPINVERAKKGLNKANSLWFWGAGTRPSLSGFYEKTGKKGAMVSAVDLLKGIAVGAGMRNMEVEGANGGLHTNYEGKVMAAIQALKEGSDFVYIHVEAPDEMGHQGNMENKITAIEYLDEKIIARMQEELAKMGEDYRMLVMPDHPTPLAIRTHSSDPVPYLLFDSTKEMNGQPEYSEAAGKASGIYVENGYELMNHLLEI
jgi:2,3-bisphosphoglycerate-independent phosphoglycerate mutase